MKICLKTPLPRFANELWDELKLFFPVEAFAVTPTSAPIDDPRAQFTVDRSTPDMEPLLHTFDELDGEWRCTFTFRGQSLTRRMPVPTEIAEVASGDGERDASSAASGDGVSDASSAASTDSERRADDGVSTDSVRAASNAASGDTMRDAGDGVSTDSVSGASNAASSDSMRTADNVVSADSVSDASNAASADSERGASNGRALADSMRTAINAASSDGSTTTALPSDVPTPAELERKRLQKRLCKLTLYELCKQLTGERPPWGSLTGIRPTRLLVADLSRGLTLAQAECALCDEFDVSPEKAALLGRIVTVQQTLPAPCSSEADVYVSIPFCRTRCVYCSFPGEALGSGRQVAPYLQALFAELDEAARLLADAGLKLRAVYIGGGTPTALNEADFEALLARVSALFPQPYEFTVEAGRPDTITRAKLLSMLAHGVTRISVNPQTMNDATLRAIGRDHTAQQTVEAFELARGLGFEDINMDVIAGLPQESPDDFARSLEQICALKPDSLTVHTLAIKRSSRLHSQHFVPTAASEVAAMVQLGEEAAARLGMQPYYLYRQKYMAGQQQNVGYAREGAACLYNVDIMEETTSIVACGAGAISKRVFEDRGVRILRAPNVANVAEYTARVAEMAQRRRELWV